MQLEKKYPGYASKYNLVTFCENTPYAEASQRGHAQDNWLMKYCDQHDTSNMTDQDLEMIFNELKK
jgi:hypothetical protein